MTPEKRGRWFGGFPAGVLVVAVLVFGGAGPVAADWIGLGLNGWKALALAVDPETPTTLYAGTDGGGVFKTTDGGASWNAGLTNRMVLALALDPQTPTTLYAGTYGGVFKTTDGGASWSAAGLANRIVLALALDPQTPTTLYAGTDGGGVFKTTDGGASWSAMNGGLTLLTVRALALDPQTPTTLYAGTDGGGIFRWTTPLWTLIVGKAGTGLGTVTSSPAGIACGSDCSQAYPGGTPVTLTATASGGSTFTGWSGACTGTGSCQVTMNGPRTVTASFSLMSPRVTLTAPQPFATESPLRAGTFRVTRTGPTTSALTVSFTRSGTATAGTDYVDFPLSVTLPVGASAADLVLTPKLDALAEPVETVLLTLRPSAAYTIGTPSSATVSIVSAEDTLISLTAPDPIAGENPLNPGRFRVSRTGPTTASLTVSFTQGGTATSGRDYVPLPTSLTFLPGQSVRDLIVTPLNDALIEAPETVILCLSPHAAYLIQPPSCATVTLRSDEQPSVTVTAADPLAGEAGLNPGRFRLTRTGASTAPLTVYYTIGGSATPGSDYQSLGTSLTFLSGQTIRDLVVTPINDTLMELAETVTLTLTANPVYSLGSPRSATLTLTSDEVVTRIVTVRASDPIATEAGLTPGVFTFTRTGSTASGLTVTYKIAGTATSGVDYQSFGASVTFLAGQNTATKTILPLQDSFPEPNETVTITLVPSTAYAVGTPSSATVTITSND
jgi:hypothetical protein